MDLESKGKVYFEGLGVAFSALKGSRLIYIYIYRYIYIYIMYT